MLIEFSEDAARLRRAATEALDADADLKQALEVIEWMIATARLAEIDRVGPPRHGGSLLTLIGDKAGIISFTDPRGHVNLQITGDEDLLLQIEQLYPDAPLWERGYQFMVFALAEVSLTEAWDRDANNRTKRD